MQFELKRIHREVGTTFLFVTHDQEEALVMADRIVVMNNSGLEQVGTAREIYDSPATPFVADFVGEMNWLGAEAGSGREVVLGCGAGIKVPVPFASKGPIRVGVRPERVSLVPIDVPVPAGQNSVRATVANLTFQGPNTMVELELKDGSSISCLSPATSLAPDRFAQGCEMQCVWDVSSTLVFDVSTPATA